MRKVAFTIHSPNPGRPDEVRVGMDSRAANLLITSLSNAINRLADDPRDPIFLRLRISIKGE